MELSSHSTAKKNYAGSARFALISSGAAPAASSTPHAASAPTGAAAGRPLVRSSKSASLTEAALAKAAAGSATAAPQAAQLKPLSDVLAGALARAASQSTIHPLDTMKVRIQAGRRMPPTEASAVSKFGQLVPPTPPTIPMSPADNLRTLGAQVASLYKGVWGAASGAGIAIGAYFAFYSTAHNLLTRHTDLSPSSVAFVAAGSAAFGSSVIKVPIAVCIRNVQAGNYRNALEAAQTILRDHGAKGLYRGWVPSVVEDMPDMAFKFAVYETLRSVHRGFVNRLATPQEDFAMGALSGACAAAMTTPFDVIKTRMAVGSMTMRETMALTYAEGGIKPFFRGVGPRALSNGINSAVFFCFFEALSREFKRRDVEKKVRREREAKLQEALRNTSFEQGGAVAI